MDKTPDQKAYFALLAKSYLEEQKDMMMSILDYAPELDTHIDISGLESGEWSYDDLEWRLEDGTTFDPIVKLLFLPPVSFTKALLKAPFLSLYDCIFLVGKINGNFGIVNEAMDIAYTALTKNIVSPRDPDTNLKLTDLPSISFSLEVKIPDLSWLLSFEEAEAWAVNRFGLSFKEYRDKLESEKPLADTLTDKPLNERERHEATHKDGVFSFPESEWDSKNEQEFLYRAIGALVLLLIEKTDSAKFGSRAKPNKSGIYTAISQILYDMNLKRDGQTKSTLNEILNKALDIAMTQKKP